MKVKDMLAEEAKEEQKKAELEERYEEELDQILGNDRLNDKEKAILFLKSEMFKSISGGVDRQDIMLIRDDILSKVEKIEYTDEAQFRLKLFSAVLRSLADWIDRQGESQDARRRG